MDYFDNSPFVSEVEAPDWQYQARPHSGSAKRHKDIKFELELDYGMEVLDSGKPRGAPFIGPGAMIKNDIPLTTHTKGVDKFEVVMDGPRIEIESRRIGLESHAELSTLIANIRQFIREMEAGAKVPARTVSTTNQRTNWRGDRISFKGGRARWFRLPSFRLANTAAFPIKGFGRTANWFRLSRAVSIAPQITIDIPLGSVMKLVQEIRRSQKRGPPTRLTGYRKSRPGNRSDALFDAYDAVIGDFKKKAKAGNAKSTDLTKKLAGFMILLVSYLRTSEIRYKSRDSESFPKAYTPLNVHTHFNVIFSKILSKEEQATFRRLYYDPRSGQNLYDLALDRPGSKDGTANLFPSQTHPSQRIWFGSVLTWKTLLDHAILGIPIQLIAWAESKRPGTLSLPTPLATASKGPASAGPSGARVKGVRLEMRRLGYRWWKPREWEKMARFVFDLTRKLNNIP